MAQPQKAVIISSSGPQRASISSGPPSSGSPQSFGTEPQPQRIQYGSGAPSQPQSFGMEPQPQRIQYGSGAPSQPQSFGMEPQPQQMQYGSGAPSQPQSFGMEPQPQRMQYGSGAPSQPQSFGTEPQQPQQIQYGHSQTQNFQMGGGLNQPQPQFIVESTAPPPRIGAAPTSFRNMPSEIDYTPKVGVNPNAQVGSRLENEQSVVNSPLAPETKPKHKRTVEEVIEVIADAVLQIVLFQVEAEENQSYLTQPNYEPLVAGVRYLANLAEAKAAQWGETNQKGWEEKMREKARIIKRTTLEISEALQVLQQDIFNQEAKEKLLFACREVMVNLVPLLVISDRYEVEKLIREAKKTQESVREVCKCVEEGKLETFQEAVRLTIYANVNIAKMVVARIKEIDDPELENRFEIASNTVRTIPERLINKLVAEAQDPNVQGERKKMMTDLLLALDEIILVALLSNERMFAGLLLDLEPMERDKEVVLEADLGDIMEMMSLMGPALARLAEASQSTSAGAMIPLLNRTRRQLDGLQSRLANAEGVDKDVVQQACYQCGDYLKRALGIATTAAAQKGSFSDAVPLLADAYSCWLDCEKNAVLKGLDGMDGAMIELQMAASRLAAAIEEGQSPEQVGILGAQLAQAGKLQLLEAKKIISAQQGSPIIQDLTELTRAFGESLGLALRKVKAYPALEKAVLLTDLDDVVDKSRQLGLLASLRNDEFGEDIFDDAAIPHYAQAIHSADGLASFIESKDHGQSLAAIKSLQESLNSQALVAKTAAKKCQVRAIYDDILSLSRQLAPCLRDLLDSAKGWDAQGTRAKSVNVKEFSKKMYRASVSPLQQIVDISGDLFIAAEQPAGPKRGEEVKAKAIKLCQLARDISGTDPHLKVLAVEATKLAGVLSRTDLNGENIDQLLDAVRSLLNATVSEMSLSSVEQNLGSAAVESELQLQRALQFSAAGDLERARVAMVKGDMALSRQIPLVRAATLRNPKMAEIAVRLSTLKSQLPLQNPNSKDLASAMQKLEAINSDQIRGWGNVSDQLEQVNLEVHEHSEEIQNLKKLSPISDPSSRPVVQLRASAQRGLLIARVLHVDTPSELKRKALGNKIEALKNLEHRYSAQASSSLTAPDHPESLPKLQQSSKELEGGIDEVTTVECGNRRERLEQNGRVTCQTLDSLAMSVGNPTDVTREERRLAASRLKHHNDLARPSITEAKTQQTMKRLGDLISQSGAAIERLNQLELHSGPLPEAEAQKVADDLLRTKKICMAITMLALRALDEEAQPKRAQVTEIKNFAQAAKAISNAVDHMEEDDTPKGRLYSTAKKVGMEMGVLSEAHKKREIVASAQRLAGLLKTFARDGQLVSSHVSDKKMKENITTSSKLASNFATQLKILCAVKLTTAETDPSTEDQLVTCGAELANSVVRTVDTVSVSEQTKKFEEM